jgi:hypothetical protein
MMDTTKKSLGEMSLGELAAIPCEGEALLPLTKEARARGKKQATERAERERKNRELDGHPPVEPAIPDDVLQEARLPGLAAVEIILQRRERCATERATLETKLADARSVHEWNWTARAELRAAAIVRGVTPPSDDGADRREAEAIRELEGEIDALARAEQQFELQARETLANAVRTEAWFVQRRLRREGLEQMLAGCRLLAEGQAHIEAAERAGHQERSRVSKALRLELGPASRITPGALIERADPRDRMGRATVTVGRVPDQVERLDDPATAVIRAYFEGATGVSPVLAAGWYHRLAPNVVLETIYLLEQEIAALDDLLALGMTRQQMATKVKAVLEQRPLA